MTQGWWPYDLHRGILPTFLKLLPFLQLLNHYRYSFKFILFIFHMHILVIRPFRSCKKNWPSDLDRGIWPKISKTLNHRHNVWTVRDRNFIFWQINPAYGTLSNDTRLITFWSWLWHLTYISKTLTFSITFEPLEVDISYFTCNEALLIMQKNWPSYFHLELWPTYLKL